MNGQIAIDDTGAAWSYFWGIWFRAPMFDLERG